MGTKRVDYDGDTPKKGKPQYWTSPNKPLSEIMPKLREKLLRFGTGPRNGKPSISKNERRKEVL